MSPWNWPRRMRTANAFWFLWLSPPDFGGAKAGHQELNVGNPKPYTAIHRAEWLTIRIRWVINIIPQMGSCFEPKMQMNMGIASIPGSIFNRQCLGLSPPSPQRTFTVTLGGKQQTQWDKTWWNSKDGNYAAYRVILRISAKIKGMTDDDHLHGMRPSLFWCQFDL